MPSINLTAIKQTTRMGLSWSPGNQGNPEYRMRMSYVNGTWDGLNFVQVGTEQTMEVAVESATGNQIGAHHAALLVAINQTIAPTSGATLALVTGPRADVGSIYVSS